MHKNFGKIIVTAILLGIILQYTLVYNINGNKIENYIVHKISKTSKENTANIVVLDKLKTDFGLVVLFETSIKDKPIGYAVFEKDAIFNRYGNEDFAIYENRHNGDQDALVDLSSENVFEIQDDKIELINSKQNKKGLIKYYVNGIIFLISAIYGSYTWIKQLIRNKSL
ncbi:hypothetical protein [Clostridium sp.]|uniref:hypothetical protein n=1 Tax=Clostridium sp. TaxID=1506 RepID=UPI001A3E9FBA|nr:hypothetical protein [Clostridium sp.]MBK5234254.1 hypothetical protein [Clostridium sp.]